jgi:RNA polymerase-interacting CarD/CdnL/TRCF family regulator
MKLYPRSTGSERQSFCQAGASSFSHKLTLEADMNFHEGDSVMHWTHGLGKVVRMETMALSGEKILYYAIQIGDMTVWVPADDMLETRLRIPTDAAEFKRLMDILTHPGESLPVDRFARKKLLLDWLQDGSVEALFRVIRSLSTYRHFHPLNEDDQAFLKRTRRALLGEWSFIMSIPLAEAEHELQHLLVYHSSRIQEEQVEELKAGKQPA